MRTVLNICGITILCLFPACGGDGNEVADSGAIDEGDMRSGDGRGNEPDESLATTSCEPESVTLGIDGEPVCVPVVEPPVTVIWSDTGHSAAVGDEITLTAVKSYSCVGAELVTWQWFWQKPDSDRLLVADADAEEVDVLIETSGKHIFSLIIRDSNGALSCKEATYTVMVE